LAALYAALEEAVSDAIVTERCEDAVLARLIELAIIDIQEGRSLFPNPLDEPVMYHRHFKRWVQTGLTEAQAIREKVEKQP
jgi:hypothetical protein